MSLLKLSIGVLFLLISAQGVAREPGARSKPKKSGPELWYVISELKKEGYNAWREGQPWPRTEPNYAAEKGWTLPAADVQRGLSRKLHTEPEVDAYIKWQLLSFAPYIQPPDPKELNTIARFAPSFRPQPVIREEWIETTSTGGASIAIVTEHAYVAGFEVETSNNAVAINPVIGVVSSGTSMGVQGSMTNYITIIRSANDRLQGERTRVWMANEMITKYRDELARRFPSEQAVRFQWMIHDLSERIVAGDPSSRERVAALVEESGKLPRNLDAQTREGLAKQIRELSQLQTVVHDSLQPGSHENDAVLHTHTVFMPEADVSVILERILGHG